MSLDTLKERLARAYSRLKHQTYHQLRERDGDLKSLLQAVQLYDPNALDKLDLYSDETATIYTITPTASTTAAVLTQLGLDLVHGGTMNNTLREIDPAKRLVRDYFLDSKGHYVDAPYVMNIIKDQLLALCQSLAHPEHPLSLPLTENNKLVLMNNVPTLHRYVDSHLHLCYTGTTKERHEPKHIKEGRTDP